MTMHNTALYQNTDTLKGIDRQRKPSWVSTNDTWVRNVKCMKCEIWNLIEYCGITNDLCENCESLWNMWEAWIIWLVWCDYVWNEITTWEVRLFVWKFQSKTMMWCIWVEKLSCNDWTCVVKSKSKKKLVRSVWRTASACLKHCSHCKRKKLIISVWSWGIAHTVRPCCMQDNFWKSRQLVSDM